MDSFVNYGDPNMAHQQTWIEGGAAVTGGTRGSLHEATATIAAGLQATAERRRRWAARALRGLEFALAALFVGAGVATLVGTPDVMAQFGTIGNATGLGAWFRMTTGVLEVLGGLLLCVRAAAGVGAVVLGTVMAGAVVAHLVVLHTAPTEAVALIVALAPVAYAHRATLAVVAAHLERNL